MDIRVGRRRKCLDPLGSLGIRGSLQPVIGARVTSTTTSSKQNTHSSTLQRFFLRKKAHSRLHLNARLHPKLHTRTFTFAPAHTFIHTCASIHTHRHMFTSCTVTGTDPHCIRKRVQDGADTCICEAFHLLGSSSLPPEMPHIVSVAVLQ